MQIILLILKILLVFFVVTGIIYWFNLDMKLVRKIYDLLQKHYDTMERDKKF